MFSISFYKLAIISPCRRAWVFIFKKSEFPLTKNALCQVWLNLAMYFWYKKIKYSPYIFIILRLSSLEERVWALISKNLNSIYPRIFMQNLVEIGQTIFKYFQYNFTISLLSALWEGRGPSFEQTWISSTKGCFVSSLVEIELVDLNF